MKRDNEGTFFGEIITITNTYNREQIYNGIKFSVQYYGLEPFETGYESSDNFTTKFESKMRGVQNQSLTH